MSWVITFGIWFISCFSCCLYQPRMCSHRYAEFFQNVVTPLFDLWDQFLMSDLSKQLIANLNFNYNQWQYFLTRKPSIDRRHSMTFSHRSSSSSSKGDDDDDETTAIQSQTFRCSRSLNELVLSATSIPLAVVSALPVTQETQESRDTKKKRPRPSSLTIPVHRPQDPTRTADTVHETHGEDDDEEDKDQGGKFCDGIHGCGTPSSLGSPASEFSSDGGSNADSDDTSEDILSNHPLKTHSDPTDHDPFSSPDADPFLDPLQSSHHLPQAHPFAPQYWGRRGSAPGCIGFYASAELAAAALVFLQGTLNSNPRRSSAPVEAGNNRKQSWRQHRLSSNESRDSLLFFSLFDQLDHETSTSPA